MKEIFLDFLEVSASMAIVIAVIALFSSLIDKNSVQNGNIGSGFSLQ